MISIILDWVNFIYKMNDQTIVDLVMRRSIILLITLIAAIAFGYFFHASGDMNERESHSGHGSTEAANGMMPTEAGQSAFAAIAEIVALLANDPDTEWSRVDVTRLRNHLVDMDLVTTRANVTQSKEGNAISFDVTGSGRILAAIQAMVPAHAEELNKTTSWNVSAAKKADGVVMTLSPGTESERLQIAGLGFFGVMATGAHHQAHHLAMAKGEMHGH